MKQFFEILFHVFCCALLPLSVTVYLLVAINICLFGEIVFPKTLLLLFCGTLPVWGFIVFMYFCFHVKLLTVYFARKMVFSNSIAIIVFMLLLTMFIVVTAIPLTRSFILFFYTFLCLLPRAYMYVYKYFKKKHSRKKKKVPER